jgi:hypothetical protein
MSDHAPLIAKFIITAATADWQRLGVASLPHHDGDRAALPEQPIWRVEEHVIGCRTAAFCRRDWRVAERGLCEHVIARDLTLLQADARLRELLAGEEARCEE